MNHIKHKSELLNEKDSKMSCGVSETVRFSPAPKKIVSAKKRWDVWLLMLISSLPNMTQAVIRRWGVGLPLTVPFIANFISGSIFGQASKLYGFASPSLYSLFN